MASKYVHVLIPVNVTTDGKIGTLLRRLFCGLSAVTWSQRERTRTAAEKAIMTTEAETGVIWPQIKSGQLSPEAERGKEWISSRASTETLALLLP